MEIRQKDSFNKMKDWHKSDRVSLHKENEEKNKENKNSTITKGNGGNKSVSVSSNESEKEEDKENDNSHENRILNNEDNDSEEEEDEENEIHKSLSKSYKLGPAVGNGSFGTVYEAICVDTNEKVAIKKVLQDPQYKNRELLIMKKIKHVNIIFLKDYYYTETYKKDEKKIFLNVVMEYVPQTIHKCMKFYSRNNQTMPIFLVKLYSYQLCRALAYLHARQICHRDLKPQNLLIDPSTHVLKLCDFGSAKNLIPGQWSVAYICSRFYRAPELMLGSTSYTTHIDLWSLGCIISEMILGRPLFSGVTSVDQLVRIIQVLGTPTEKQVREMNPTYTEVKFPNVKPKDLKKVFPRNTPELAIKLVTQFLKYEPLKRTSAIDALGDPFFDELRDPSYKLPAYIEKLPELFNFTEDEVLQMSEKNRSIIIPKHLHDKYQHLINEKTSNDTNEKKDADENILDVTA